jgi:hypothetical protein
MLFGGTNDVLTGGTGVDAFSVSGTDATITDLEDDETIVLGFNPDDYATLPTVGDMTFQTNADDTGVEVVLDGNVVVTVLGATVAGFDTDAISTVFY